MANTLFEVTVLNGNTPVTLRMARKGASDKGTLLNNFLWRPVITKRHGIGGSWAESGILQEGSVNHSSLTFFVSGQDDTEVWSSYEWMGGLARIFVGQDGDDFSAYKQVFEGSVSSLDRDGPFVTVGLLGPDALLDRNILTAEYQGTGAAEGPVGIKGQLKPRTFGYAQNVDPVLIDPARWIYQVHGYGAITGIKVYDFGQELDPAKNKGDAGNYATLANLAMVPGEWATCAAEGMFRLGGATTKKVTADVQASGPSTLSGIVRDLMTLAGIATTKQGSSLDTFPVAWNLYQTEQAAIGDIARDAVFQAGGMLFADGTGKWQIMDYFAGSTSVVLNSDRSTAPLVKSVKELPSAPPVWKVKVGYDRCWSVHSSDEVSASLSASSDDAQAAFDAAQAAQEAADQAIADAKVSKERLDAIADDNILDRSDKAYIEQRFAAATAERPTLLSKGNASTERTAYSNAYDALKTHLEGLSPAYSDGTQDTAIDRSTWDQKWTAFDSARSALYASLSTWDGVTGANKPADSATVGAQLGTNLTGENGVNLGREDVLNSAGAFAATLTYTFDDNTLGGFYGTGATLAAANGILSITATTNDPLVYVSLSKPGKDVSVIRVRMRPKADGQSWQGQIYYQNATHSDSEGFTKFIGNPGFRKDEWRIVEWDMNYPSAGGSDYINGNIDRVRFDFANSPGEVWEVDWIQLGARLNGTIGAPVGTNVGDRPVTQVISEIDKALGGADGAAKAAAEAKASVSLNTDSIVKSALRQEDYQAVLDARTTLNGQPIGTVVVDFKTETTQNNTALATTLALIGAKNGDGSAFVLNLEATKVTPTQSLAEKFTSIEATSGGNTASIKNLNEVVVGPTGGTARAVLNLDVNGFVSGTVATNNGTSSSFTIIASEFKVVSDVNGQSVVPFLIQGDKTYLKNVIVENITYGSLTPLFANEYSLLNPAAGFQKMPGGFIIQWGQYRSTGMSERGVDITFPIPFPNALMSAQATAYINVANQNDRDIWVQVTSNRDRTHAQFQAQANEDGNTIDGFDWMAYGY